MVRARVLRLHAQLLHPVLPAVGARLLGPLASIRWGLLKAAPGLRRPAARQESGADASPARRRPVEVPPEVPHSVRGSSSEGDGAEEGSLSEASDIEEGEEEESIVQEMSAPNLTWQQVPAGCCATAAAVAA